MFSEEESGAESEHSDNSFSNPEIWRPSPSPEETFSDAEGADGNGNWDVQIIGEEVDSQGNVRYEASWKGWTRSDGTNVTWDNDLIHPDDIRPWKKAQALRRVKLAEESLDIEVWATTDIHNTNTRLRAQAFEEKLKKREQNPLNLREQMMELMAKKKPEWTGLNVATKSSSTRSGNQTSSSSKPESSRASVASTLQSARYSTIDLDDHEDSRASSTRSKSKMKAPITPVAKPASSISVASSTRSHRGQTADSTASASASHRSSTFSSSARYSTPATSVTSISVSHATVSSAKGKGKARADDIPRLVSPLPARARRILASPPPPPRRRSLELQWTAAARRCGAASVSIANEVDDEEIPDLPPKFRYIESEYRYSNKVRRPDNDDADYFIRCECENCETAMACACQGPSELVDEYGNKAYAYTEEGLFAFNVPQGMEVIECNEYCSCHPKECPNRVAQQPRTVPIEIFKTLDRGWGARAPIDVELGMVLGIYTGLLIRRDAEEALSDDERTYCFDLDGHEDPDAATPDEAYSVDSRMYGNWTRFINHSCDPNLRVYLVVYDTIPEMNMPYLAFVATKDIPAQTEFTFDYDPAAANVKSKGKGKGKGKGRIAMPEGAKPCMCGAARCRGWVSM